MSWVLPCSQQLETVAGFAYRMCAYHFHIVSLACDVSICLHKLVQMHAYGHTWELATVKLCVLVYCCFQYTSIQNLSLALVVADVQLTNRDSSSYPAADSEEMSAKRTNSIRVTWTRRLCIHEGIQALRLVRWGLVWATAGTTYVCACHTRALVSWAWKARLPRNS
jgi:hypothetical protein